MSKEVPCVFTVESGFRVEVDYGISLEEMVKRGDYGYVTWNLSFSDSLKDGKDIGKIVVDFKLIHFSVSPMGLQAGDWCYKAGFRVANFPELMAFGAAYPEEQLSSWIFALGATRLFGRANDDAVYAFGINKYQGVRAVGIGGPYNFVGGCRHWSDCLDLEHSPIHSFPEGARFLVS